MSGKASPSLRRKTLYNVERCNLSMTDKNCIREVFERYENRVEVVRCEKCKYYEKLEYPILESKLHGTCTYRPMGYCVTESTDYCSHGIRKEGAE